MHKCDSCRAVLCHPNKKYCPDCGHNLGEAEEDPKLYSLKDALARAKKQEQALLSERQRAIREHDEATAYARKCGEELLFYKRDLERRTNAAVAADFLEREAKKLREHPETFGEAEFCQNRPMEYVDQHYPYFVDNTPVVTTFKMTTWPQRKVAKEGEEK